MSTINRMSENSNFVQFSSRKPFGTNKIKSRFYILGQLVKICHPQANLPIYMREIKQRLTCFYHKRPERKGYFWGDRLKSVIVEYELTDVDKFRYKTRYLANSGING